MQIYNPYSNLIQQFGSDNPYANYVDNVVGGGYQEVNTFFETCGASSLSCCRFDPYKELLWTGTTNVSFLTYSSSILDIFVHTNRGG